MNFYHVQVDEDYRGLILPQRGVNQYIPKNMVDGMEVSHILPTIQDAVCMIQQCKSTTTHMAAVDGSRAYKNFCVCPVDWPLMAVHHGQAAYLDTALPFGAKSSSYSMQQAAKFITRALAQRGANTQMYLEDLFIAAPYWDEADQHYNAALKLLTGLGLPIAELKLQPPARELVWLGININLHNYTISIPNSKLNEINDVIACAASRTSIPINDVQSLIGSINHLSKAVHPARLFMGRTLEALHETQEDYIRVNDHVKADLR